MSSKSRTPRWERRASRSRKARKGVAGLPPTSLTQRCVAKLQLWQAALARSAVRGTARSLEFPSPKGQAKAGAQLRQSLWTIFASFRSTSSGPKWCNDPASPCRLFLAVHPALACRGSRDFEDTLSAVLQSFEPKPGMQRTKNFTGSSRSIASKRWPGLGSRDGYTEKKCKKEM